MEEEDPERLEQQLKTAQKALQSETQLNSELLKQIEQLKRENQELRKVRRVQKAQFGKSEHPTCTDIAILHSDLQSIQEDLQMIQFKQKKMTKEFYHHSRSKKIDEYLQSGQLLMKNGIETEIKVKNMLSQMDSIKYQLQIASELLDQSKAKEQSLRESGQSLLSLLSLAHHSCVESSISSLNQSDKNEHWFLWKTIMICRYFFRKLFGFKSLLKVGHFVERQMCDIISEFGNWIEYPKGNHDLIGHDDYVYSAVVSSGGRYLYSAGKSGFIRRWDLTLNESLGEWAAHSGPIWMLITHLDSLISCSTDATIRFWDQSTQECNRSFIGHTKKVRSISVDNTGDFLVSSSVDQTIRVWSLDNGQCVSLLKGHTDGVCRALFIGDTIISCADDRTLKIWNHYDDDDCSTFIRSISEGISHQIWDLSINCDGTKVACMPYQSSAIVYQWPNMEEIRRLKSAWACLCFHPWNPDLLAVGCKSHTVKLFDIRDGDTLVTFDNHSSTVRTLCFTPDGFRLISGSQDKSVKVWDLSTVLK